MLSYRHAFHAGNFADVLKHLILVHILEHLKKKDAPFCYVDTHSGPGIYDLQGDYALLNREFDSGIGKLLRCGELPSSVASYVELVSAFNRSSQLKYYPGSPSIAQKMLRPNDRLFLYELHATEIIRLNAHFAKDRRAKVFHADGLSEAVSLMPPSQRRALVLMDPSYEIKSDYQEAIETLIKMHKRFATGTYALWYPVIERSRVRRLEQAIKTTGIKNIKLFELGIRADSRGHGMTASGMIVVNPPWTLADAMQQSLPWLSRMLAENDEGHYRIEALASE